MMEDFQTPAGLPVVMFIRDGTNDHDTAQACMTQDEYGLAGMHFCGEALDIGGYAGGVTIGLLMDNPKLHVTIVEPLPANLELIRRNLEANRLTERATVIDGAAGTDGRILFMGDGNEYHGFVGNAHFARRAKHPKSLTATCYSLSALMPPEGLSLLKIDCEGCEWSFLSDPAIGKVEMIVGEWHPPGTATDLLMLLRPTHEVQFIGEHDFAAVLR